MVKTRIKVTEAAGMLGIHPDTLRRWDEIGQLVPTRSPAGTRLYLRSQIINVLQKKKFKKKMKEDLIKILIKTMKEMLADSAQMTLDVTIDNIQYTVSVKVMKR